MTFSFAQRTENREKIKSLKVAFITDRLELSAKEAQQFWPVYNDYEDKREALRQKERTQIKSKIRDAASLTEKEAEVLLKQFLSFHALKVVHYPIHHLVLKVQKHYCNFPSQLTCSASHSRMSTGA